MHAHSLTRRASLMLPFLLAACGGGDERTFFAPLHYEYLPAIPLNVATIDTELRFLPVHTGDVTASDPVNPVEALRGLAMDRLKAVSNNARAVFSIRDASLTMRGDQINGAMEVTLEVLTDDGQHAGYAQARVRRVHTGRVDNLRGTLYDLTSGMLDDMNVELEFQIRRNLRDWVSTEVNAAPTPVEAAPLEDPFGR
jgi:hypothetical protein